MDVIRHIVATVLGIYVAVLSLIISVMHLAFYNEFRAKESATYAFLNTLAMFIFIILLAKYAFCKEKGRWLHYYLVVHSTYIAANIDTIQIIVPIAFSLLLLYGEIKHALSNRVRR